MKNSLFPESSDEFMDVFTDEGCDEANIETNNIFLNNHLKKKYQRMVSNYLMLILKKQKVEPIDMQV